MQYELWSVQKEYPAKLKSLTPAASIDTTTIDGCYSEICKPQERCGWGDLC